MYNTYMHMHMHMHMHVFTGHCLQAGANMIVSGSAVVKSTEPAKVIAEMRTIGERCLHPA